MKSRFLLLMLTITLIFVTGFVNAHDEGTLHGEDDNSDPQFLGILIGFILLVFLVSGYYGKKTKEKLYGISKDQ